MWLLRWGVWRYLRFCSVCLNPAAPFPPQCAGFVAIVGVLAGMYTIALGKTQADYTWNHLIPYNLNGGEDVTISDLDVVRSDFYESIDNAAMFWEIPVDSGVPQRGAWLDYGFL